MRSLVAAVVIAATTQLAVADPPRSVADLARARVDVAARGYDLVHTMFKSGAATVDAVCLWSERWRDAQRDTVKGKAATAIADDHVARMIVLQGEVQAQVQAGTRSTADQLTADYCRADAELDAARAHGRR